MRCLHCGRDGVSTSENFCPKCGVHLPSLMRDLLPMGSLLRGGAYRIDYPLGRGGFGITYRAIHLGLEKLVAIKEFYPREHAVRNSSTQSLSIPPTQQEVYRRGLQRFVQEGRILAKLSHGNVVQVQDLFEEGTTAYLVMEMVEGKTLKEELASHPQHRLPPQQVETVMAQLVAALEAVHQNGVYHLDIKPDNVLLSGEGRVVLVDFGAARQGFSSRTTRAYTEDYAAPEVIAGRDIGPESDIFELGMMLHEMLTGERPTPALSRLIKDTWQPKDLEEPWRSLIQAALPLRLQERPHSVKNWWEGKGSQASSGGSDEFTTASEQAATTGFDTEAWITLSLREAFYGVEKSLNCGGEVFNVRIPPGAKPGSRLRIKGKGLFDSNTKRWGNLYLTVEISPDSVFQLEEENLIYKAVIAAAQSESGAAIEVPTIDGSVIVNFPAGIRSGQRLRLSGKGLPMPDGRRGDQLVEVLVEPPTKSSEKASTLPKVTLIVSQKGEGQYRTITEAIQNAQPGTRILVRPGIYTEGLVIDKPIEILGDGPVEEIVIKSTNMSCLVMQTDYAVVRSLTLLGRGAQQNEYFAAVDIPQGQLILEECDITNDSRSCIAIHGSTANPVIRNCQIHDGKEGGVIVHTNGQGTVVDCDIFGNALSGVYIKEGGNPTIRNCQIHDGKASGVFVHTNGQGTVVDCDIFGNTFSGVEISEGGNPTIRNCQIHDGKEGGVIVHTNGQGTVVDCDIFGNASSGVYIKEGGNPVIQGCKINRNKGLGVYVHDNGTGTVENCNLTDNRGGALEIASGCRVQRNGNKTG